MMWREVGQNPAEKANCEIVTNSNRMRPDLVVDPQISSERVGPFNGLGFSESKRTTKSPIRFSCNSRESTFQLSFWTFFTLMYNEIKKRNKAPIVVVAQHLRRPRSKNPKR